MAQVVTEVTQKSVENTEAPNVAPVAAAPSTAAKKERHITIAERVIYYIGGVITSLIALRILLSVLGANRENAFASFIYSITYPFVSPFFGLFNYHMRYGVSRFEFESLIALIVIAMLTAAVARLVTITSHRDDA